MPLQIQRRKIIVQHFTEDLGDDIGLDMILVSGGNFIMGSPEDEPEREDNEGPQHEVTVPTFVMGRHPITQAQWKAVAAMERVKDELDRDPSNFKGDDRPVENVSWFDAVEFCQRLSNHTQRTYRLPTEAEWEYACRAGTITPFYFGKTLTDELANYRATVTYNDGPEGQYRGGTMTVGNFPANVFGLSDMHGNVLEWCQDHYHSSYEGAPDDGGAWTEEYDSSHVLRGGSWVDFPGNCRSARRGWDDPSLRVDAFGFRVVCAAPRT